MSSGEKSVSLIPDSNERLLSSGGTLWCGVRRRRRNEDEVSAVIGGHRRGGYGRAIGGRRVDNWNSHSWAKS